MSRSKPTISSLMGVVLVVAFVIFVGREAENLWMMPWIGLALVPGLYLVGPILIHQTQWTSLDLHFEPIDLGGSTVPPEISAAFRDVARALTPRGFALVQAGFIPSLVPNAKGYSALFENPKTASVGRLIGSIA